MVRFKRTCRKTKPTKDAYIKGKERMLNYNSKEEHQLKETASTGPHCLRCIHHTMPMLAYFQSSNKKINYKNNRGNDYFDECPIGHCL